MAIKTTCSGCGKPLGATKFGKYRYCLDCQSEASKKSQKLHPHFQTDERMMRNTARSLALKKLKRSGKTRRECISCGNLNSQIHHEDYSKPHEIIFLCKNCHLLYHQGAQIVVDKVKEEMAFITKKRA